MWGINPKTPTNMKEAEDKSRLVEVFSGSLWEAELVKGLLKDRCISSSIRDGLLANGVLPETMLSVALEVNEADYEPAMDVIRERNRQTQGE